jgi:hypothetical protein
MKHKNCLNFTKNIVNTSERKGEGGNQERGNQETRKEEEESSSGPLC